MRILEGLPLHLCPWGGSFAVSLCRHSQLPPDPRARDAVDSQQTGSVLDCSPSRPARTQLHTHLPCPPLPGCGPSSSLPWGLAFATSLPPLGGLGAVFCCTLSCYSQQQFLHTLGTSGIRTGRTEHVSSSPEQEGNGSRRCPFLSLLLRLNRSQLWCEPLSAVFGQKLWARGGAARPSQS